MPFGFGFGELALILVIVIVAFGATRLPDLRERMIPIRLRGRRGAERQWTQSDWLIAVALALLAAVVLGNAVLATAPRR